MENPALKLKRDFCHPGKKREGGCVCEFTRLGCCFVIERKKSRTLLMYMYIHMKRFLLAMETCKVHAEV